MGGVGSFGIGFEPVPVSFSFADTPGGGSEELLPDWSQILSSSWSKRVAKTPPITPIFCSKVEEGRQRKGHRTRAAAFQEGALVPPHNTSAYISLARI